VLELASKPMLTLEAVDLLLPHLLLHQSKDLLHLHQSKDLLPLHQSKDPLHPHQLNKIHLHQPLEDHHSVVVAAFAVQVNVAVNGVIVVMVMLIVELVAKAAAEEAQHLHHQKETLHLLHLHLLHHPLAVEQSSVVDNLVQLVAANGDIVVSPMLIVS